MIFPKCQFWSCIPIGSPRGWSGSRKVAADRPWHHQDDWRCSPWKIQRVSGRFCWNQHAKFSLKPAREVFGLKWPKQPDPSEVLLYFLVSKSKSRGISLERGQGRSQEEMAPCQSCHTAGELFAEVGTTPSADWMGNPTSFFFFFFGRTIIITSKRSFFLVYYQRLALTFFSCDHRGQCLA